MQIPIQQTYRGRTAGGWLRGARVVQTDSGDSHVGHPELPGCLLVETESGALVIGGDEIEVRLTVSPRAAERLADLGREAAARY